MRRGLRGLASFQVLWSLRTAQNRPEHAQSRSEPLRIAQSAPRAAQSRLERSLRAVRGTAQGRPERAQSWSELLRVAQSAPRAAQSRSESLGACSEPLRAALNRPERSLRAARKTDRGARCHMHFAYQMLSFTSHGSLFSVHVYARVRASIYIYTRCFGRAPPGLRI